jgi:hypothetical protein
VSARDTKYWRLSSQERARWINQWRLQTLEQAAEISSSAPRFILYLTRRGCGGSRLTMRSSAFGLAVFMPRGASAGGSDCSLPW